ncbi:MAG: RNA polymerase sigma-70 factor [Prevotella sp.]|nr:RNA polymerase sigma-70 factor [Prevotella sp.]
MRDNSEFDDIFREYYSPLYFFARQYVDDEDECRDIVSEAYERAWNNFRNIKRQSAKTFLFVTTRNLCLDYVRHQVRHRQYARYCEVMSNEMTVETDRIEREELQQQINRQIESLQPPTRDIFISCYVERKKYKEVALERGITVSTVKKHIIRALKIIRELNSKK